MESCNRMTYLFDIDVSLFELPEYKGVPVLPEVVRPTISAIPYSPIIEEADVEMVNAYKHVLIHFLGGWGLSIYAKL